MKIFKFLRVYKDFNKIIDELKRFETISKSKMIKHSNAAKNNSNTMAAYHRKKYEFYRGQNDISNKISVLIENFIKTRKITQIKDDIDA